ncbi:retrovirus-related pol polyprotein from transposon TNT 1-94 [Tanacetum coccineum]
MRERNQDPLALVANHQMTPPHFNTYQSSYNNHQFQQQFSPSHSQYGSTHPTQHYSTTYLSTPLAITYPPAPPVFKQGDDHIDAINKMISFLSTVVTSRFPTTNNELRNSSNPRQQATIHDERVTVQPLQGRPNSYVAGTSGTRANTSRAKGNYSGPQRVVKCFNCQGECHMARQCPKPKRKRNATWFREKFLLVKAQENGKVLNEKELEFLADPGIAEAKVVLMANLSSYDSDVLSEVPYSENTNNDMLNLTVQDTNSFAKQDAMILSMFEQLSEQVTNCNKVNKDNLMANETLFAELEIYKERVKLLEERQNMDLSTREKLIIDDFEKEINYLKQTLSEQLKENESLTKTFNVFKNESKEKEARNIDNEIALEKKVKELDNIVCKMGQSTQTVHMLTKPQVFYDNNLKQAIGFQNPLYLKKAQQIRPMLYDGNVIEKETNVISIPDSEETLMLEEESRSKMLLKQSDPMELSAGQAFHLQMSNPSNDSSNVSPVKLDVPSELPKVRLVNASLKKLKFHLAQFDYVVKKRITPDARTKGIFNVFDKDFLNEIVQTVFDQMETIVQQYSVDKRCLEIANNQLLNKNDRLLEQIISQDIVNFVVTSSENMNASVNVKDSVNYVEMCNKCLELEAELVKQHTMVEKDEYNKLSKSYSQLEQHCISLELAIQLNQEIFQKNNTSVNQTESSFDQLFKVNNLKAQLQSKDTTIKKLKTQIKRVSKTSTTNSVKKDIDEIATINIELKHRVAKPIAENEHLKKTYKQLYDSIKPSCVRAKEQTLKDDLRKIKGKDIVDNVAQMSKAITITPGMYKIDPIILAPMDKNNRDTHIYYLKHTMEQAAILREIVEQAKSLNPLDSASYTACKYVKLIQELLGYIRDTCPDIYKASEKLITVTPKNNVKKVRFSKPLTSSNNTQQVESSKTSDSNTPVLSSIGVKCSTSTCRSQPTGNKMNDRISQPSSSNIKNKVEVQPRKVNKKNRVVDSICNANVKQTMLNANSQLIYNDKKKEEWKLTGKVFTKIGYTWRPIRRTFSLVGNAFPLTRITATNKKPLRVPIPLDVVAQDLVVTKVYTKRPKFLGTIKFGNDQVAKIMGYGDYQIGNVTISRVYYVEGLGHNLFSVGHFCDSDLEVAFRKHTCFVRNLEGVDLLSGSREPNLYSLSIGDMMESSPICLLSKATKTKSWLWHHRLSHLNFGDIKFEKDHLCSVCAMGKSKKHSHKPKSEDTNQEKLYILHMDICGPMRAASVNRKKYILVIVEDYSRFTWVKFLASKDKPPDFIIKFMKMIQVRLNAPVRNTRTDNGAEFVNQTPRDYYEQVGISYETLVARTPQQNGVVEKRNHTLVEAARTMLIFIKAPLFLWVEAVATAYAPSLSTSQTTPQSQSQAITLRAEEESHDLEVAHMSNDPYFGIPIPETVSEESSSSDVISTTMHPDAPNSEHPIKWIKDHLIENIIGELFRPVSTRLQLHEQALFCYYDAFLTSVKPKTYKEALTHSCWIEAMQEELNEFERLEV